MRSALLLFVLLAGDLEAFAGEVSISTSTLASDPVWDFAPAFNPHVASSGEGFLVAWETSDPWTTRVARVRWDGVVIDRGGIQLPYHGTIKDVVAVASGFVILTTADTDGVYAHHLSTEGQFTKPPIRVVDSQQAAFSAASNGQQFVIIRKEPSWDYPPQRPGLNVDIYSHDLRPLSQGILEFDDLTAIRDPLVSSNGDEFLISWIGSGTKGGGLYTLPLSDQPPDATRRRSYDLAHGFAVGSIMVSDGQNYLRVWEHLGRLAWFAFDSEGKALNESESIPIISSSSLNDVVWSGVDYWLMSGEERFHVSSTGRFLRMERGVSADRAARAADRILLVSHRAHPQGSREIIGRLVTPSGNLLRNAFDETSFPIAESFARQQTPAGTFDGENYLVVWSEFTADQWQLFAGRVALSGKVLDGRGIRVAASDAYQAWPTAVFDGENFAVFWYEATSSSSQIVGRFLSRDAIPIGEPVVVASDVARFVGRPAAAVSPSGILVVFSVGDFRRRVMGVRVTRAGVIDPGGFPIAFPSVSSLSRAPHDTGQPSVAYAGDSYLVAWTEEVPIPPGICSIGICSPWWIQTNVRAARVSLTGLVTRGEIPIATSDVDENLPLVVSLGSEFMVVWNIWPSINESAKVIGVKRVALDGRVLEGSDVAIEGGRRRFAVFDGRDVLIGAPSTFQDAAGFYMYRARPNGAKTQLSRGERIPYGSVTASAVTAAPGTFRVFSEQPLPWLGGGTTRITTFTLSGWANPRARPSRR